MQVLCTTSTLAVGVNLPAHLVVIKGTSRYCGSEKKGQGEALTLEGTQTEGAGAVGPYREYDRSVCLQVSTPNPVKRYVLIDPQAKIGFWYKYTCYHFVEA